MTASTAAVMIGGAGSASADDQNLPTWPANPNWTNYVHSNDASTLAPTSVSTIGDVSHADGLVDGSGQTTLTFVAGQTPPIVVLDYGKEVGGLPFFNVASASPASPAASVTMRAGYSEVKQYLLGSGPSTTLAAPADAGATTVKVASTTNLVVGAPLTVDSGAGAQQVTITAVGSAGASGSGITITPALAAGHAAGASVTSSAQPVVGDANGNNGVGTDSRRADTFTLTPASGGTTVGNAVTAVQGGERYEAITLTSPGSITLSGAGMTAKFNNLGSSSFAGHFVSSDDTLNRIWYDGVYTAQTDAIPQGAACSSATACSQTSSILDGAKRDRRPWSADLSVEGRTMFDSLGFGSAGSDYIKNTIGQFASAPAANGSLCGQVSNWVPYPTSKSSCSFYSASYSMYLPIDLADYYLYSGDKAFAESLYQTVKNELAYERSFVDPTLGLTTVAGRDWDFYDGSKGGTAAQGGAATATNMIYYKELSDAAWLAGQLAANDPSSADATAWTSDAQTWRSQASSLKDSINALLYDSKRGVYQLSSSNNGTHLATAVPQDANSEAILFGVSPEAANSGILSYLKSNLWGTYGPQPYSADAGYSTVISPFVTGYELNARFATGDTTSALDLTRKMWAQMVQPDGAYYTGTLWEKLGQNGQITDSNASLAHGWATAPVSAFDGYLLGVQPTGPGYATWTVAPQPGDLGWAEGDVPSPAGPITVDWAQDRAAGTFHMLVKSPAGTSGEVRVPLSSATTSVSVPLTPGATFVRRDGNVDVYHVSGGGSFEFSSGPVTFGALKKFVAAVSSDPAVTTGLNDKLTAAEGASSSRTRDNQLGAFENLVRAQTDKALTRSAAAVLLTLSAALR